MTSPVLKRICETCRTFYSATDIASHIRRKHPAQVGASCSRPRLTCDDCGGSFKSKQYLDSHLLRCFKSSCRDTEGATCEICKAQVGADEIVQHIKHCHPSIVGMCRDHLRHHCDSCSVSFRHKKQLGKHLEICGRLDKSELEEFDFDNLVFCDLCCSKMMRVTMWYHMRNIHPESVGLRGEREQKGCDGCKRKYFQLKSLADHQMLCPMRVARRKTTFKCYKCEAHFKSNADFYQHTFSSKCSDRPPMICDDCGATNKSRGNFELHVRKNHAAVRREGFTCDDCSKQILKKTNFMTHVRVCRRSELQIGADLLICDACDKSFRERGRFSEHLRNAHSMKMQGKKLCSDCLGNSALLCRNCSELKSLTTSKKNTETSKRFNCTNCSFSTTRHSRLVVHKTKHEENRFFCDRCKVSYTVRHNLQSHVIKKCSLVNIRGSKLTFMDV